ncbi:hypothetical protein [Ectopseudomonas oleovorans]|uniref:hypothetical protein n=1 Tax=Ectopseudomonas oleovorans TaxID=301 RepID=UPI001FCF16B6|nr:hypothetical protein [Pseudomonas oleovorans]
MALQELHAEASYSEGNYLGNFAAQLKGPAGDFSLSSPVSGDLGQVSLPQLQLVAGQGRAEGWSRLVLPTASTGRPCCSSAPSTRVTGWLRCRVIWQGR